MQCAPTGSDFSIVEKNLVYSAYAVRDLVMPAMTGAILYVKGLEEITIRYLLACSIILTCINFMGAISRLPRVGLYVHMLSKVMATVLNFFATYFWHFLGYAIAFHIVVPSGDFQYFADSLIKVIYTRI